MFDRHDAKGFVQYDTPGADLVTARGEVMKSTAEIEAGLNWIFLTPGSSQRTESGGMTLPSDPSMQRTARRAIADRHDAGQTTGR